MRVWVNTDVGSYPFDLPESRIIYDLKLAVIHSGKIHLDSCFWSLRLKPDKDEVLDESFSLSALLDHDPQLNSAREAVLYTHIALANSQVFPQLVDKEGKFLVNVKKGDRVWLTGLPTNARDDDLAGNGLVVSQSFIEMWNAFLGCWGRVNEFRVRGASGVGKSCCLKLLVACISREFPEIPLFYGRGSYMHDEVYMHAQSSAIKVRTVAIFDQIENNDQATRFGALGDMPNLFVILTSSANLPFLQSLDGRSADHSHHSFDMPFSSTGEDCSLVMGQAIITDYKSMMNNLNEALTATANPLDFNELCSFTNGHLESLARLVVKKISVKDLINQTAATMQERLVADVPHYLAIVHMFKLGQMSIDGPPDRRFMSSRGLWSPLFAQAYQQCLLDLPPPPDVYTTAFQDLLTKNPSEIGFALERDCLQNESIFKVVAACLNKIPSSALPPALPTIYIASPSSSRSSASAFIPVSPLRIHYRDFAGFADEINRHFPPTPPSSCSTTSSISISRIPSTSLVGSSWAMHGIPVDWNEAHINGLHMYCVEGRVFVFGFQITHKTVQQHIDSLAWFNGLAAMRAALSAIGITNVHFVLIFVAKQVTGQQVAVSAEMKGLLDEHCTVMEYPVQQLMSTTAEVLMGKGGEFTLPGPREVVLVVDKKRKTPVVVAKRQL